MTIYTLAITFDDNIQGDDAQIKEIAENILNGLVSQADNEGLAPEDSETFTTRIEVAKDGLVIASKIF